MPEDYKRKHKTDLINEDNLRQSKEILDNIVKLLMKANDVQKDSAAQFNIKKQIFAQLERYAEVSNKSLNKYNVTLSSTFGQLEDVVDIFRQSLDLQEEQNSRIEERLKLQEQEIKQLKEKEKEYTKLDKQMDKYLSNFTKLSANPVTKYRDTLEDRMSQTQQSISDMANSIIQKHKDNGTYTANNLGNIQTEIVGSLKKSGLTDQLSSLNLKMTALTEVLGVLKNTLGIITRGIGQGINKQSEVYESTYQNISTRTGTTNPTYFRNQAGTYTTLLSQGLADNIKVSDVQQMWQEMANKGTNEEDMYANALDKVITKNILPYLDVNSKSFEILNNRFDGNFAKQIRGINAANLEMAGNNYTTQDMVQTIIDELQPMSDKAVEDLAQGSTEVTAMINKMIDEGWSEEAAKSYAVQLFKSQKYGDQMMRSGSVSEKYALISAIDQGVNIYDPTRFNDFMGVAVNADQMLGGAMPGYTSTLNGIVTNFGGSALGIDYSRMQGVFNGKMTGTQLANSTNTTAAAMDEYRRREENRLKNNETQTSNYRQETTLENLGTFLAVAKEYMGKYYEVLTNILGAVKNIALAYIGGKIGGALLGKGGGSLLGNIGGAGLGSAIGSGLTSVGFQMLGEGAYTSSLTAGQMAGLGAAGVAGSTALLAGGTALGINGVNETVADFRNGNTTERTALSGIQGAAGLTAAGATAAAGIGALAGGAGAAGAIAAMATNPVGWIALAVGGIALVGKAAYDEAHKFEKAGKAVEEEFNTVATNLREEQAKREENLISIKDNLKKNKDVETQRQKLIETGLLSEKDLQKAREANIDGLEKLTDKYLESSKKMTNTELELNEEIKKEKAQEANEAAKSIKDWFDNDFKKNNTEANNDVARSLISNMANVLNAKGEANWTDSEKDFMKRYKKHANNLYNTEKVDYDDLKWIIKGGWAWAGMSDAIMENTAGLLENTTFGAYANSKGKGIKDYEGVDTSLYPYYSAIVNASSKSELKKAVENAKAAGMVYDDWKKYNNNALESKLKSYGMNGFRYGTDSIPYDNYPALLHEGEAVLTASTANEMRNLVDEYRDTKENKSSFDVIIESQTVAIIDKMDEIIALMNSNSNAITESAARSFVNSAKEAQMNSMIKMKNSKSW